MADGNEDAPMIDVDGLADETATTQPDPSEHVISEAEAERQEAGEDQGDGGGGADFGGGAADAPTDRDGRSFDPEIHVTDADGEPRLTAKGNLKKRPGRKGGGDGSAASTVATGPSAADQPDPEAAKAREAGRNAADALIMMGVTIGGAEWQPVVDKRSGVDERAQLREAWGQYFEEKGYADIPPGVALTIATVGYAAPRLLQGEQTRSRVSKLGTWIKAKWNGWRGKRKAKRAPSNPSEAAREEG